MTGVGSLKAAYDRSKLDGVTEVSRLVIGASKLQNYYSVRVVFPWRCQKASPDTP